MEKFFKRSNEHVKRCVEGFFSIESIIYGNQLTSEKRENKCNKSREIWTCKIENRYNSKLVLY